MVEQLTVNQWVAGSNPAPGAKAVNQLVGCQGVYPALTEVRPREPTGHYSN